MAKEINVTDLNDSLDDLLGGPAVSKPLPQDEAFARIREQGIGEQPVAKLFKVPCQKCHGRGRFVSYTGRDVGPCYTCKGVGHFMRKHTAAQLQANRYKAEDRKDRQQANRWELFAGKHPEQAAWILAEKDKFEFAGKMHEAVLKYGDLTIGQMAAVDRGVERARQWAAQRAQKAAQQQEAVKGINVANIVDAFQRAHEAGLKRFQLRFDGVHFAADRNDPAKIWVSSAGYGSDRLGLIQAGVFRPGRDFNTEIGARIELISADPMAAARAYGQITNSCSVCGRHLENQDSVDAGIGPVCAGRINRPGLKFVEVKPGVDF